MPFRVAKLAAVPLNRQQWHPLTERPSTIAAGNHLATKPLRPLREALSADSVMSASLRRLVLESRLQLQSFYRVPDLWQLSRALHC